MDNITIGELAKKAGVSKTVVSAVINNKINEKIFASEHVQKKVLDLVKEYSYTPRKSARALASQKTNTIGLIAHRLTPRFSAFLEEFQEQALKKKLDIMPYITKGYPEKEEEYLNLMKDGRVDGVIIAAVVNGSPVRYTKFAHPPYNLKILTISPPMKNIPSVQWEEEDGGKIAARHLIEIGCTQLATFGDKADYPRNKGFIRFAQTKRTPVRIIGEEASNGDFITFKNCARKFVQTKNLPDGIFAYNDLAAIALLSEALKKGLRVPEDISIMGCDNTEVCLYSHPTLTSIDTNVSLTARLAMEKMIDFINGKDIKSLHTKIMPRLIIRESTMKSKK